MPPSGIGTHDLSRRAAVDLRLRQRGHWDRPLPFIQSKNKVKFTLEQATKAQRGSRGAAVLLLPPWL